MIRLPKTAVDSLRSSAQRVDNVEPIIAYEFDDGTAEAYGVDAARIAMHAPQETLIEETYATGEKTAYLSMSREHAHAILSGISFRHGITLILFNAADVIATWEG